MLLLVDCKLDSGVDLLTDCPDGKAVGVDDELLNRLFNVSWNEGWDKIVPTSSLLSLRPIVVRHPCLKFLNFNIGEKNNQKPQTDKFYMLSFSKIINREARARQNGQAVLQVITSNIF